MPGTGRPLEIGDRSGVADGENVRMPWHRKIGADFHPPGTVGLGIEPACGWRSHHAGSPNDRAGIDPADLEIDALRIALDHACIGFNLDTGALKRRAHVVGLLGRECRQQARSRFYQRNAGRARIDAAEIRGQGLPRDLRDRAGHFDPGGAAADDDESEQTPLRSGVGHELGLLEGNQNAAADAGRILDTLQARRIIGPFVVTEIGMHSAGRDHQIIVSNVAEIGVQQLLRRIDAVHLFHQHRHIRLSAQDVPNWPGHIGRRQRRGRHLIEQRLEAMMVLAIDHDDIGGRASQRLGGFQAAEAGTDDHHFRSVSRHRVSSGSAR